MKLVLFFFFNWSSIVKIAMLALCLKVAVPLQFRKLINRLQAGSVCSGKWPFVCHRFIRIYCVLNVCFGLLCLSLGLVAYVLFVMVREVSKSANKIYERPQ